jgi:hypothetical protein
MGLKLLLLTVAPVAAGVLYTYPSAATTAYCAFFLLFSTLMYLYPYRAYMIPFKNIQGPESTSVFWGVLRDIMKAPPNALHEEWIAKYGPVVRYRLLLGQQRIFSSDPAFIGYIFQHADDFIKPGHANRALQNLLGDGVLTAEGAVHRRQRRVINPAFGPAAIRGMEPIFWDKTYELQQKLLGFFDEESKEVTSPTPATPEDNIKDGIKIDVQKYLAQGTLEVIGAAGFNYDFGGELWRSRCNSHAQHSGRTRTNLQRHSAKCSRSGSRSRPRLCSRPYSPSSVFW